jgi:hypothetical protein
LSGISPETLTIKAQEVTTENVKRARHQIVAKYARATPPYNAIAKAAAKVNFSHIRGLVNNWYSMDEGVRLGIIMMFEQSGLSDFLWLCLPESGANPNEVSSAGAIGLFQIMPKTAKLACGLDIKEELFDPEINAACAVVVLEKFGAKRNRNFAYVLYNGKVSDCPAKGYFACLQQRYLDAKEAGVPDDKMPNYLGPSLYVATALVHQEIGERFIYKPHNYTP